MTEKRVPREGRIFRIIGGGGFCLMLLTNLVESYGMGQSSADIFSDGWWSSWFSGYIFWLIILGVGLAGRRRTGSLLPVEEVPGSSPRNADPVSGQLVFDRVFKIYVERHGKETEPEILQAIRRVLRSEDEAELFFERCEDLGNDARHFVRLKVIGQMELPAVRSALMQEHPQLSEDTLQRAIEFGAILAAKE